MKCAGFLRSLGRGLSLACLAVSCVTGSLAYAEFIPINGMDGQLFPSYVISTASMKAARSDNPHRLGDPRGLFGVVVTSPSAGTRVTVTVECREICETSTFTGTLAEANVDYVITPKLKYFYDVLAQTEQASPISVTFRVQLGNGVEEEHTTNCTLCSINDCPFAFRVGDKSIDLSYTFAAYVNEQHPFVDKLLREALDIGFIEQFDGYQQRDEAAVLRQAYALWDLLVARDIRYSSITATAVESDSVYSQHVRLIEDSINNSQANCVDGSVLWASLMRKIGIDTFLVVTSDHCYAGFYRQSGQEGLLAIETTLLGADISLAEVEVPQVILDAIPEDMRNEVSFASFVKALEVGTISLLAALERDSQEAKSDTSPAQSVQVINIAAARKDGILPIPFTNKEGFVWRELNETTQSASTGKPAKAPSGSSSNGQSSTTSNGRVRVNNPDGTTKYLVDGYVVGQTMFGRNGELVFVGDETILAEEESFLVADEGDLVDGEGMVADDEAMTAEDEAMTADDEAMAADDTSLAADDSEEIADDESSSDADDSDVSDDSDE